MIHIFKSSFKKIENIKFYKFLGYKLVNTLQGYTGGVYSLAYNQDNT